MAELHVRTQVLLRSAGDRGGLGAYEFLWDELGKSPADPAALFSLGRYYERPVRDIPRQGLGEGSLHIAAIYRLDDPLFAGVHPLYLPVVTGFRSEYCRCVDTMLACYEKALAIAPDWDYPLLMLGQILKDLRLDDVRAKRLLEAAMGACENADTKQLIRNALQDLAWDWKATLARLARSGPSALSGGLLVRLSSDFKLVSIARMAAEPKHAALLRTTPPRVEGQPSPAELPKEWSFLCPGCGAELQAEEGMAGKTGECGACGKTVVVPAPRPVQREPAQPAVSAARQPPSPAAASAAQRPVPSAGLRPPPAAGSPGPAPGSPTPAAARPGQTRTAAQVPAPENRPPFDAARCRQLLAAKGRKPDLVETDIRLIGAAAAGQAQFPEAMVQEAKASGKDLEVWMWDQIGPAQAFVLQAYRESRDLTEFAARLALQGQAKWALHLYRAVGRLQGKRSPA